MLTLRLGIIDLQIFDSMIWLRWKNDSVILFA